MGLLMLRRTLRVVTRGSVVVMRAIMAALTLTLTLTLRTLVALSTLMVHDQP